MKLTRQHFELIAEVLRDTNPTGGEPLTPAELQAADDYTNGADDTHSDIVKLFTDRLAATNPAFDAERFTAACGR